MGETPQAVKEREYKFNRSSMLRRTRLALVLLLVPAPLFSKGLDIYLIDMSACTLIVTPEREAILIDCGHKMLEKRDVERIRKVVE